MPASNKASAISAATSAMPLVVRHKVTWWQNPMFWTLLRAAIGLPCVGFMAGALAGWWSHELGWSMGVLFALAMVTDFLDGKMARMYGLESRFGAVLDHVLDKIVVGCGFFVVAVGSGLTPGWRQSLELLQALAPGLSVLSSDLIGHSLGIAVCVVVMLRDGSSVMMRLLDDAAAADLQGRGVEACSISPSPQLLGKIKVWLQTYVLASVFVTVGAEASVLRDAVALLQVCVSLVLLLVCVVSFCTYLKPRWPLYMQALRTLRPRQ